VEVAVVLLPQIAMLDKVEVAMVAEIMEVHRQELQIQAVAQAALGLQ